MDGVDRDSTEPWSIPVTTPTVPLLTQIRLSLRKQTTSSPSRNDRPQRGGGAPRSDRTRSPRVADADYAAGHVAALDMATTTDNEIFDRAVADALAAVTADSDSGKILALRRASDPSMTHVQCVAELGPEDHGNLPTIAGDLSRGAIASLSPARRAVCDLPLR